MADGGIYDKELRLGVSWDLTGTQRFFENFEALLASVGATAVGPESFGAGEILRNFEQTFDELATYVTSKVAPEIAAAFDFASYKGILQQSLLGLGEFKNADVAVLGAGYAHASDVIANTPRNGVVSGAELTPAESEAAATTRKLAEARVVEATAALEAAAAEDVAKAASEDYRNATVSAATGRLELAAAEADAKVESTKYLDATVNAAIKRNEQSVAEAAQAAASDDLLRSTVADATALNASAAIHDASLAADPLYLESVALAAAALNTRAAAEDNAKAKSKLYTDSVDAALDAKNALTKAELDATAATREQAAAALALAEASAGGAGAGVAAGAAASEGAAAGETAAAAGGAGLLGSFGSIAPLIAGFSIYRQIREGIKDATDLEKVLAVTRVQMEDLGKGVDFEQFKQGILDISTSSGVAATQVAQTAQQFQGAFGGDTVRALNETRSAMEAVRITGLSLSEVVNVFLALQESFQQTGVTIADLTDKAVGLQQRTGTKAAETLTFASQIAPIASESGFSAQDTEALGATIEKFSGKSAQANAEALGRVFSGIQGKAVQLIEFLQANAPQIADSVAQSLNSGDIRTAFVTLLQNYDSLGQSQQQQLLYTLAGRREAATLSAAFSDSAAVLDELRGAYNDTGKGQQTFNEVQDTLGQQVAELSASFKKLGVDIYDAGLKELLEGIAGAITGVVKAADTIASIFATVNTATHGLVGELALLLATLRGIQLVADTDLFGKLLGRLGLTAIGTTPLAEVTAEGGAGVAAATGLKGVLGQFNPITGIKAGVAGFGAEQAGFGLGAGGLGASIETGFSAAFTAAGPGLVLAGALAANSIIAAFNSGFESNYDKDLRARLGGKTSVDTISDIDKLLADRNNIGGGAIQSSAALANYLATHTDVHAGEGGINRDPEALKPSEALDNAVRNHASGWQQIIDDVPGASRSQDIDANIKALHQAEDAQTGQVNGALEKLQASDQLTNKFVEELNAAGKGGLLGPDPKAKIEGLIASIGKAQGKYENLSPEDQALVSQLTQALPEVDKAGGDIAAQIKAITDKADAQDKIATDAVTAKQQLDDGVIGLGEYLVAAGKLGDSLKTLAEGGSDPKATAAYVKNQKEQGKEISDTLRHSTDFLIEARGIAGTDSPKQDVADLTTLLNNPQFTDTADQLSATKALIAAIKKEKQYEASLVTDVKQKAAILASTDNLPLAGQQALYGEFLQYSLGFQTFLANTLNNDATLQQTISNLVAVQLANGAKDVRTATIAADQIEIKTLQNILATSQEFAHLTHNTAATAAIINQIKTLDEQLGTLVVTDIPGFGNVLGGSIGKGAGDLKDIPLPDFGHVGDPPDASAQAAAAKQAKEDALSQLDIEAANARGDAVRLAEIAKERASLNFQLATTDAERNQAIAAGITADQALTDAYVSHDAALRDLAVAQGGDDPVQAAQAAVDNAKEALAKAIGPDAIIKAQADLARAQSALVRAVRAGLDAQFDFLIAMDNFNGDTVKAAQDALAKLIAHRADPLNDTERQQLETQILSASLSVSNAEISQGEKDIQTQLELKHITAQQAIAQLELLKRYAVNKEEIDQINVEIEHLKDGLSADYKFNLPTGVDLPTVYEARRLESAAALPGGSGNYQDNRQIQINITATQALDLQPAVDIIIDAAQAAPRNSSRLGNY